MAWMPPRGGGYRPGVNTNPQPMPPPPPALPPPRMEAPPDVGWIEFDYRLRTGCGWLRHDWDQGNSTPIGGATETSTSRYTCQKCGKVKYRNNGMG